MGTHPRYRYLLIVTIVLFASLVLLQACGREDAPATATPRAGGVVVDEQADSNAASAEAEAAAPVEAAPPAPAPFVFTVGAVVTATAPLSMYASAASASNVLEVYGSGTPFTVLEPNDQFTAYPVTNGGASWVRLRAADGLAGWARADALPN